MDSLPLSYLHLETGVFFLFLVMMTWTQLKRASDAHYFTQFGKIQAMVLMFFFAGFLCVFAAPLYNTSPLLALELAVGCTLALLHPANALCLLVHVLYLRPWETSAANAILLALPRLLSGICFLSWLIHPSLHAKPNREAYRLMRIILFFGFWLYLGSFFTPSSSDTQSDLFGTYFKVLSIFIMCLFFLESELSVSEFENTIVLSSLAIMLVALWQFFTVGTSSGRLGAVGGMFSDPNDLAAVVVMAIPLAIVPAFRKNTDLFHQSFGAIFAGFSAIVIWYTRSRGAMMALFIQFFTSQFMKAPKEKRLGLLALAIVLAISGSLVLKAIPRSAGDMQMSSESRIIYWRTAVKMALRNPVFGVGFDQYPDNYEKYNTGFTYEIGRRTAHSSWFLALAESGVFGLFLYVTFIVSVIRVAWNNRLRRSGQLYSIIGYCVAMSFLSHTYIMYPYMLTGLVLASGSLPAPRRESNEPA